MRSCPTPSIPSSNPSSFNARGGARPAAGRRLGTGLAAIALAVALLSACGGGDDTTDGATSSALAVTDTSQGMSVTLHARTDGDSAAGSGTASAAPARAPSKSSSDDTQDDAEQDDDDNDDAATERKWTATQYALDASITSGPHAGQALGGALLLKGELKSDGTTRLKGRFVPTASDSGVAPIVTTLRNSSALDSSRPRFRFRFTNRTYQRQAPRSTGFSSETRHAPPAWPARLWPGLPPPKS